MKFEEWYWQAMTNKWWFLTIMGEPIWDIDDDIIAYLEDEGVIEDK